MRHRDLCEISNKRMTPAKSPSSGLSWGRIALSVILLVATISAIPAARLLAWRNTTHDVSPVTWHEDDAFVLTPQFAAENDVQVLKAIFADQCSGKEGVELVSDRPIGRLDERSGRGLNVFPQGLECAGLRIVPDKEIMNSSWRTLQARFRGLSVIGRVSLPSYSRSGTHASVLSEHFGGCQFCASGWEIILNRINGKWVVSGRTSRWIS